MQAVNGRERFGLCYIAILRQISIRSERCCFLSCLTFSKATHLTSSNLVALMNCSLERQSTYPVEVWKLFFQKASTALDQALASFATTVNPKPQFDHDGVPLCEFCVKQNDFSNSRPPTAAAHPCHMLLRLLER